MKPSCSSEIFATGHEAVQLGRTERVDGSGLCGWVACNRRTLVNANRLIAFQAAGIEM